MIYITKGSGQPWISGPGCTLENLPHFSIISAYESDFKSDFYTVPRHYGWPQVTPTGSSVIFRLIEPTINH